VPHDLYSGTKSFWGVLAVAAEEDGLLRLDERAADTLGEWREDPRRSRITVRLLLDLTSGLDLGTRALQGRTTPDKYAHAVSLAAVEEPGERFRYGPGHYFAFGALLARKLSERKEDPLAYLRRRILDPIGLGVADWARDAAGNPALPHGARLTAREWAKLGDLVRRGGTVDGRPLVSREGLERCFVGSAANPGYGLTWWLPGRGGVDPVGRPLPAAPPGTMPPDVRMAAGLGRQLLLVVPSLDLVVVRFGAQRRWDDAEFHRLLFGAVLARDATAADRSRAFVRRYDRDGDGALAADEAPAPLPAVFPRLDADGDGRLAPDEVESALD
jgi:CubicO group peptidase (beta-lactamase class C family)